VGRSVPLLPVPAGTENVLAKAVGIPANPQVIREILEAGRIRAMDVGYANGHAFLVMSGVGFDASVTREVHQNRRGPIKRWYYYWPSFRNWLGYRWPHLEVEVDGSRAAQGAALVIVGNMRLYADRLHVCANALPDDGLLDVCVFTRPGRWNLLSYFLSVKLGRHLKRSDVVYRQGARIVVRPEERAVPFQVDGDTVGLAPVEYTVRPKAIQMLVRAFQ
jgi:diacylglycerol kinase family enzyme